MPASEPLDATALPAADPAAAPSIDASEEPELIARQIHAVSRLTPAMMLANISCAAATVLVMHREGLATLSTLA